MREQQLSRRGLLGAAGTAAIGLTVPIRASARAGRAASLFSTERGDGRNLLLLHGWTADSNDWSWQLPVFETRYRTIAVDLRGHGRSEVMPPGQYAPDDYVNDVEALIDKRFPRERFIVIGHSMGGQIAARLAMRRPDLVQAVVSVDGSLGFDASVGPVFARTSLDLARLDPMLVAPKLFDLFYDPSTPAAFKRWHARRVEGMPAHVVRESFGPLFLGQDQVGIGPSSESFCRSLRLPVYHLCRDPAQATRMRAWFGHPRSKVELWDHAGHWIMQDRPDDVNAAVAKWIDGLS